MKYIYVHAGQGRWHVAYGFSKLGFLNLFEQLITAKGVGPKAGPAIMSTGPKLTILNTGIVNKEG